MEEVKLPASSSQQQISYIRYILAGMRVHTRSILQEKEEKKKQATNKEGGSLKVKICPFLRFNVI